MNWYQTNSMKKHFIMKETCIFLNYSPLGLKGESDGQGLSDGDMEGEFEVYVIFPKEMKSGG